MITRSEIPVIKFIELKKSLPEVNFRKYNGKGKKIISFLYSMLSNVIAKQIFSSKHFFTSSQTLVNIQSYLNDHQYEVNGLQFLNSTSVFTITTYSSFFQTSMFIITPVTNGWVLDVLTYKNLELSSWISGVFEDKSNMYLKIAYNINEVESINLLNLYGLIINFNVIEIV